MNINSKTLHNNSIVADLHCDTVWSIKKGLRFSERNNFGHIDLPRLKEGSVNIQLFACFVHPAIEGEQSKKVVDNLLDILHKEIEENRNDINICNNSSEINNTISTKKIAAVLTIENGQAINSDIANLEHFYNRSVRSITLTHSKSHNWCESSSDPRVGFSGLSEFGNKVIKRMNEIGMLVDVSHISPRAVSDVLKITSKPIIASHSNVFALCPHDRNLSDDQIKAIADNGGIIGVNFCNEFLSQEHWDTQIRLGKEYPYEARLLEQSLCRDDLNPLTNDEQSEVDKLLAIYTKEVLKKPVPLSLIIDHIDYIVKLVGDDFVGIGSDYDGIFLPTEEISDCSKLTVITEKLLERNYSETSIKKILGENFLRVFKEVCG